MCVCVCNSFTTSVLFWKPCKCIPVIQVTDSWEERHGSGKRINEASHGNISRGNCCCCQAPWIAKIRKNRYISGERRNTTTDRHHSSPGTIREKEPISSQLKLVLKIWVLIYLLCKIWSVSMHYNLVQEMHYSLLKSLNTNTNAKGHVCLLKGYICHWSSC